MRIRRGRQRGVGSDTRRREHRAKRVLTTVELPAGHSGRAPHPEKGDNITRLAREECVERGKCVVGPVGRRQQIHEHRHSAHAVGKRTDGRPALPFGSGLIFFMRCDTRTGNMTAQRGDARNRFGLLTGLAYAATHHSGRLQVELQQSFTRADVPGIELHRFLELRFDAPGEYPLPHHADVLRERTKRPAEPEMILRILSIRRHRFLKRLYR